MGWGSASGALSGGPIRPKARTEVAVGSVRFLAVCDHYHPLNRPLPGVPILKMVTLGAQLPDR